MNVGYACENGVDMAPPVNIGADAATGAFSRVISVGDRFLPGKLAAQKAAIMERELDVVGANVQVIDGVGNPVGENRAFPESGDELRGDILNGLALFPSSPMMRKEVWARVGGYSTDPAFRFAEDLEFFARVAAHPSDFRFGNLGTVLCQDRPHDGRVTRSRLTRDLNRMADQRVRGGVVGLAAAAQRG